MSDTPIVVTLERPVSVPGGNHYPSDSRHFRCREHAEPNGSDGMYTFYGLNIGPENTVLDVSADNVRGIAYVGDVID